VSSTSRGGQRQASDYYVTPVEDIRLFLREWQKDLDESYKRDYPSSRVNTFYAILDPCAGGDAVMPMSYPKAIDTEWRYTGGPAEEAELLTLDIREDSHAEIKTDFLQWPVTWHPDLIITNPPFAIAQQVIEKSLSMHPQYVVMLLRLNYFGSDKRKEWFKAHMPKWCYVHSRRMNFMKHLTAEQLQEYGIKNKGTDSIEYMHAVWTPGDYAPWTKLRVI
jgi:hypothetical protein